MHYFKYCKEENPRLEYQNDDWNEYRYGTIFELRFTHLGTAIKEFVQHSDWVKRVDNHLLII
jgi:hypothetical protein